MRRNQRILAERGFLNSFIPGDALEEIKNLQMGSNSIEDHNAKFQMLLTKSKLDKTSPAIINYYHETLNLPLQK